MYIFNLGIIIVTYTDGSQYLTSLDYPQKKGENKSQKAP